ncbi:MarR family winged helix-turn-helix transcriptional regulator [Actinomycetospora straminea]|uniref:MarR family winged helix-turn-helix transcriptional regulator n=1 Tax=Actinomycetospora straminea TaxID=663607 RepID=A0ABP9EEC5_9PSEU|nr:MarR family winged helix-turn-helix transcriptional regulator [Actinomycetospora straminea]MDD7932178.1 MarR family winged helix-turn-helix transcriptional regulator [Actinomycetospora straminea]
MPDASGPPAVPPLGLQLASTAREVSRAFDAALAAAGGSMSTWLVLLSLVTGHAESQRELAAAVGIQGATLTHHLNGMEAAGLVTRRRDPANRRVHLVELTDAGRAAFLRLRDVAVEHDRRLRAGLDPDDEAAARRVLDRLRANVAAVEVS